MMIGGLIMGQDIPRAFQNFDTLYEQEKSENQAECVILTGETIFKLLS